MQSNFDDQIQVEGSYSIFPDRANQSKGWLLSGSLPPFVVFGLGLVFGMITAINHRLKIQGHLDVNNSNFSTSSIGV